MDRTKFTTWNLFNGLIMDDEDERFPTRIYGLNNMGSAPEVMTVKIEGGAIFGFVQAGDVAIGSPGLGTVLPMNRWFCVAWEGIFTITRRPPSCVVLVQRVGWRGINCTGGPIEEAGRLRYIDGCSDSLLISPPVKGDPCFNHLHFPEGIDQTSHTHPSTRAGVVVGGRGACVTPERTQPLGPGMIWFIPAGGVHKFQTLDGEDMDVVAYHPDSDFGPTHEEHPMLNKTLVDGTKIDNTGEEHRAKEIVTG